MRIHLELDPARVVKKTPAGGAAAPNFLPAHPAGPLLKLGLTPDGHEDVVLIELQGELTYEGESSGRTIGLLGFERPDRPTLHLGHHHLLHGRMVDLPRPYAVIRRVTASSGKRPRLGDTADEDESGEEEDSEVEDERLPSATPSRPTASSSALPSHLQRPPDTPSRAPASSSPLGAPAAARDYSSDLSSPVMPAAAARRRKRKPREDLDSERDAAGSTPRTREYELVAMVRRKVVFSLRPEPIVTATVLPE